MKRAIRYLRFSCLGQSNGSIERQELYTDQWLEFNKVSLVDTFIDRGKSARTFDRPDFIKLQDFIIRHHKTVDYLLVDQLDRFSRDAGEAMSMVKSLQNKYSIQIVSVTEGITFDYNTPGSFFRAGLQLLLAEEDNINRSIKVRGGIYTAKAKEGRFILRNPPFGYRKEGERKEKKLVIEEEEAKIIKFIYDSYLRGVPLYIIKEKAREMGYSVKGNTAVERALTNPVYIGMIAAKAFKDYPGGVFPGIHEPIIDRVSWDLVQEKMKKPKKTRAIIDDSLPLRGMIKCHCGMPLTGAASRGRAGDYYYYYKCNGKRHTNLSAKKAHNQFLEICRLMSLPDTWVDKIRSGSKEAIEREMKANKLKASEKKRSLKITEERLKSVEEKWINNEITRDTYDRWYANYTHEILNLKGAIERLSMDQSVVFEILDRNLGALTNVGHIYSVSNTLQKREFVNLVFDNNLYYKDGIYRTPTMMKVFSHNTLIMREKGLLYYEKKEGFSEKIPLSSPGGNRTPTKGTGNLRSIH